MVKGMGITPSLVPLTSGSSKDNLTISIQRRKKMKAFHMMQAQNGRLNEFDDYKTDEKEESSHQKDEYQMINASNLLVHRHTSRMKYRRKWSRRIQNTPSDVCG